MEFNRRIAQLLHEDHAKTLGIIEALEDMAARSKRKPPDINDPIVKETLKQTTSAVQLEISTHFAFEEAELFTRLADIGDVGIGMHLTEEHRAMLPVGEKLAELAKQALETGFSDESWREFSNYGGEFIERMLAHIQKEEMALLPMLDELIDAETDMELSQTYSDAKV